MAGSAVYLSFARLGMSRSPQSVQVETRLSQGGGSAASGLSDQRDLSMHLRACQRLEWREPIKRQTHLGQDRTGVDPFDVTRCQSSCLFKSNPVTHERISNFGDSIFTGQFHFTTALDLSDLDNEIQTAYVYYFQFIYLCSVLLGFPTEEELTEFRNSEMFGNIEQ